MVYSLNPWENALPILRVIGPAQQARFKVIPGNRMETVSPRLVSAADMVVVQRDFPRLTKAYNEILNRCRKEGKSIVYDLDDLLLELPDVHPDRVTNYYADAFLPMIQAMLDADMVTASTSLLCEYLHTFNPNSRLLPNYLNENIWSFRTPKLKTRSSQPIVIGFIGSDTHAHDIALIAPTLEEVLQSYGNEVRVKFYGCKPPSGLLGLPNVELIPLGLYIYAEYAKFVLHQECDIVLAPLEDTLFNRCKSPIKFLEYSALGAAGVYSKITPYETVIKHNVNGFLANTLDEWKEYLFRLIEHPQLRYQMAVEAQRTVHENWLLSQNAHAWREVYEDVCSPIRNGVSKRIYPVQFTEQALIRTRTVVTPPGSLRERICLTPYRTIQVISTEGLSGLIHRFVEKVGLSKSRGLMPTFLSKEDSTESKLTESSLKTKYITHVMSESKYQGIEKSLPKASLIILTYNDINYTRLCLDSIFTVTQYPNYEVIIIDNASIDGTPKYLKEFANSHPNIHLIFNDSNLGFAHGNNQGAQSATGDILVFLNNDTVVTSGWLSRLARHLSYPKVGMVGPVTNSSGNESQISVDYRNLNELQAFAQRYTREHSGKVIEIRMLAFLCVALRRSVFEEVGLLDEQFGLGMFEDDDYSLRVKKKGYQIICAQDVFVHHWGSVSFSHLSRKVFFRVFKENQQKFESKWETRWLPPRTHK